LAAILEGMKIILEQPAIACFLGLFTGALMILILVVFANIASDKNPTTGMALSMMGVILSTVFGIGILFIYKWLAGQGFVWFGIAAIVGYFIGLGAYTVQNIRKMSDSNQ
jgi:MFS family permease